MDINIALKEVSPRLPISKCKLVAKSDPDYILHTKSAYIATTFATELFISTFSEQAMVMAQLDKLKNTTKKQLRLNYKDLARVVSQVDKFSFLNDVIPETKLLSELVREKKVRYTASEPPRDLGQTMLPFKKLKNTGAEISAAVFEDGDEEEIASEEEHLEPSRLQQEIEEVARMNQVIGINDDEESSDTDADAVDDLEDAMDD